MAKETIEQVSDVILDLLDKNRYTRLEHQLDGHDIKAFLAHNFIYRSSRIYLDDLMMASKKYWNFFMIADWIDVFRGVRDHVPGLKYCVGFLYRYLQIDSLKIFSALDFLDPSVKANVLFDFQERPGLLAVMEKFHDLQLTHFGYDRSDFNSIRDRLIAEGASPAIPVEPNIIKF